MKKLFALLALASVLIPMSGQRFLTPALQAQGQEYLVGVQDVLTVTVFGEPDLSGKYPVAQDGTFTFPQLGRLKAGGLTLRAIETELKRQLADGYLKNPQVSIAIETYRSQRILVLGEVKQPGEYQLNGEMTLLSALVRAGSTTPMAGRHVLVVRAPVSRGAAGREGEAETLRIELAELQSGAVNTNVRLRDGDTINVPKALSVFVSGQVKNPGAYPVESGMTILQVVTLAGGLTDRGSDSRLKVLRLVDGKQKELKVKLTDIVEPGDTIVVQERFF